MKIGLSGTALKSTPIRNMDLRGLFGSVVGRIKNVDLVNRKISAVPIIKMLTYKFSDLNEVKDIKQLNLEIKLLNKQYHATSNYGQKIRIEKDLKELRRIRYTFIQELGLVKNKKRTRKIYKVVNRYPDDSILIIVNIISHGKHIKKYLTKKGIKCTFVSGKDNDKVRDKVKKDFSDGKIKVLIASLIYKEGVDIPNIDDLIIACGGKAPHTILQIFGRGLRRSSDRDFVRVYDFDDRGHEILEKHSIARRRIYLNEGFEIK